MSKSIHEQCVIKAQQSKEALTNYLWDKYLDDTHLMALVARALTDTKIEAILTGLSMQEFRAELQAYARGYMEGLDDAR